VVLMDNNNIDEDITLIDNIPLGRERLYKINKISVKLIKMNIVRHKAEVTAFPYQQKLGIRNYENINPIPYHSGMERGKGGQMTTLVPG